MIEMIARFLVVLQALQGLGVPLFLHEVPRSFEPRGMLGMHQTQVFDCRLRASF